MGIDNSMQCNHILPQKEGSSLVRLKKLKMVKPQTMDCFCKNCNQIFRFVKDDTGEFSLVTDIKV